MHRLLDIPLASSTGMPASRLSLQRVRHAYAEHLAVDDVSLEVMPGEVVCLLGPSGCGKTTLLRIAAGLERLQHGELRLGEEMLDEAEGHHVPPEKRGVGLAFQEAALFPHLSVLENVAFGLDNLPPSQRRARAMQWLEQLGMAARADTYPHMLSGGQQQRVALARALAPEPRLMLLDEPFSSLDARLREQIRDDTLHALKRVGAGTLLVTHDPEEAMFMADRIALMREGRVVQWGTPYQLYCQPQTPFVVTFFGAVNEWVGEVREAKVMTPAGGVAAPALAEGSRARVMVRPEALRVTHDGALMERPVGDVGIFARVVMAKLLGRSSLLHLAVPDEKGQEVHWHAQVPGVFLPRAGQSVALQLEPSQCFAFPA
ncbi:ABC transporter ATP-binding protein [Chromohalobacter nigrandesensis]|uniref:ABC transporter ATP-binding protein n=1 Tax=Chromohalobacter nigrandesensis TaxID=119863 RepID=UPI001FF663B9|nr:ABC transporter ATP-binding protein [Chromohalobacter nigrandesensis]MCK0745427.1 ABC transporter ATP-binding protein [Chromohalobacter nigrandesensis]